MLRRAFGVMALLVACRDASSAPPTVVVPVASASSPSSPSSATASAADAAAPDVRVGFLRSPPTSVQGLLDALGIPLASAWESREKSGMGGFSVRAPPAAPDVLALSVQYRWDLYHQNPASRAEDLSPKSLESWSLTFPLARRDAVERTLLGHWGQSQSKEKPDRAAVEQYGPFYLGKPTGEAFTVEWFAATPDWSKPKVDAAIRKKAVADLAKAIASAQTVEEMQKAAATPYAGAGITSKGVYNKTDANLEFEPPMNATEFAAAIGHPKLVAESVGVHMSQWKLVDVNGTAASVPQFGLWQLDASLASRPSGAKDPRFATGPIAHYGVGASDMVRFVHIAKPGP